ncbi:MAG: general secretion pathway protein GspM [Pseudomonadales bacterium]|jgi:general secretion pathway protein M|uniref:type II secretion system protein M n=1 Tax=Halopseudomonas TaxID=2901189 RepID=UPI000C61402D|nr:MULTISPECIES: type II secretion system protein M [Halopseudomonas]MAK72910.1 general secretion pathway protein GspM [Pseudomonadales bacterium]MEE2800110.1 type II secretion system protein M [Pseudomonadota bacterium]MAS67031.1 general secretion pathway protein GspM [Pseudomonadales bacterium]MBP76156.1 general secretion pathway protein GspM [Pseudomonadales bacterium]MCK5529743.1 type II secretion system protein M [Halopseudomonas aestusnigri]|tara:strand:- start:2952 stop:3437 length:486 start_codon:yes stop_codon:yes gene_type:complete
MKAWWAGLAPRERRILVLGAVALGLILAWVAVWEPLLQGRSALRSDVARLSAEAVWMEQVADDVRRRARLEQRAPALPGAGGSVLTLIEVSANAAGLRSALTRVQPEGEGARLIMDAVGFDALMGWLAELELRQGLRVSELMIEGQQAAGQVSARLLLERR